MRNFIVLALLLVGTILGCTPVRITDVNQSGRAIGTFYVATNGNDTWSGTLANPDRTHENGPFLTISRALQAAMELKEQQGGTWQQPVTILIRGSTHWLKNAIVITPEHSGSPNAPLTLAAYPGEKPLLSAGERISNWQEVTVDGRKLLAASLPAVREHGWYFRQLWVEGERRTRARHPNTNCFPIAALPDATPTWEHGHKRFQFNSNDVINWKTATQGEAVAMTRWVESRMPITSIDKKERILTSNKRSVFQLQPGDPFYVEHIFEVLDQPGEWFLDRETATLYYQPFPHENAKTLKAIAPRLMDCVQLAGTPHEKKFVEHVRFNGLHFAHNEWYYPPGAGQNERHISTTPDPEILGSAQASFLVPGAVRAEGARLCSFDRCVFSNIGSYGITTGPRMPAQSRDRLRLSRSRCRRHSPRGNGFSHQHPGSGASQCSDRLSHLRWRHGVPWRRRDLGWSIPRQSHCAQFNSRLFLHCHFHRLDLGL